MAKSILERTLETLTMHDEELAKGQQDLVSIAQRLANETQALSKRLNDLELTVDILKARTK